MTFKKVNPKQSFPEMDGLFDVWNEEKKNIEKSEHNKTIKFKEGEIWWISMWKNIWQESYWKWKEFRRPILVLKKLSSKSCIAIPLSSRHKTWTWFCDVILEDMKRTALLYQIKMIDTKRFHRRIWVVPNIDFWEIKKRLKQLLNL